MTTKLSYSLPSWFATQCPRCHTRLFRKTLPHKTPVQARFLTITPNLRAIAAPELDDRYESETLPPTTATRVIPASPSYFTGQPSFTDAYLNIQHLLRKYQTLPTVTGSEAPRVAWRTLPQYRLMVGEPVKAAKYHKIIDVLHRLNRIHPALMPEELKEAMEPYKRDVNPYANRPTPGIIDEFGRASGIGRRKSSSAKVFLVEGEGKVLVNGRSINEAFGRIHDRESALWALKATGRIDKYNVWALVTGGGTTGQAEAITLGAARALLVHEPDLKPALRRAGCVTRNPKRVERKKPGKLKARKMPAWVKR